LASPSGDGFALPDRFSIAQSAPLSGKLHENSKPSIPLLFISGQNANLLVENTALLPKIQRRYIKSVYNDSKCMQILPRQLNQHECLHDKSLHTLSFDRRGRTHLRDSNPIVSPAIVHACIVLNPAEGLSDKPKFSS
jgi:hypothetical protein